MVPQNHPNQTIVVSKTMVLGILHLRNHHIKMWFLSGATVDPQIHTWTEPSIDATLGCWIHRGWKINSQGQRS
jgi:hypothetical protein